MDTIARGSNNTTGLFNTHATFSKSTIVRWVSFIGVLVTFGSFILITATDFRPLCLESQCFNNFLNIYNFPIKAGASTLALLAVLLAIYRSEQANQQLQTSELLLDASHLQNKFVNHYKHQEEFSNHVLSVTKQAKINVRRVIGLHRSAYPMSKQGIFKVRTQFLEECLKAENKIYSYLATTRTLKGDNEKYLFNWVLLHFSIGVLNSHLHAEESASETLGRTKWTFDIVIPEEERGSYSPSMKYGELRFETNTTSLHSYITERLSLIVDIVEFENCFFSEDDILLFGEFKDTLNRIKALPIVNIYIPDKVQMSEDAYYRILHDALSQCDDSTNATPNT